MKWIAFSRIVFVLVLWVVPAQNQKSTDVTDEQENVDDQDHWERIIQVHDIVPDVIDDAEDAAVLQVVYDNGVTVNHGDELSPEQVSNPPVEVLWAADQNEFYTIILVDPDAPIRKTHEERSWQHWIIVNIPGSDMAHGKTLTEYVGAAPPKDTGFHRYVFLVYLQQEGKTEFKRRIITNTDGNRGRFSVREFAADHHLGKPIAINFFEAKYDKYVDVIQEQLRSG